MELNSSTSNLYPRRRRCHNNRSNSTTISEDNQYRMKQHRKQVQRPRHYAATQAVRVAPIGAAKPWILPLIQAIRWIEYINPHSISLSLSSRLLAHSHIPPSSVQYSFPFNCTYCLNKRNVTKNLCNKLPFPAFNVLFSIFLALLHWRSLAAM